MGKGLPSLTAGGLADRFYLFRCPSIEDSSLLSRLAGVFDVKGRARVLERFGKDLEPPIPARILPKSYPLPGLKTYLAGLVAERLDEIVEYYRTLCG